MIDGAPENIIWCYGMYQPAYDEMLKTIPNITFVERVPVDLETLINPSIRNLVVIDDLMQVVYYVENYPRCWIGKDSLGIVYDVTHCYNLGKKCLPPY